MDEAIVAELCADLRWSAAQIDLGMRAGFRCEYCSRDLLASVDDYDSWQLDHIHPTSRGGSDDRENLAVSCKTCNFIKRSWAPPTDVIASDSSRDARSKLAREYVLARRGIKAAEVARVRQLVNQLRTATAG